MKRSILIITLLATAALGTANHEDHVPKIISNNEVGLLQTNTACNAVNDVIACNGNECYTCGARIAYLVSIGYSQTGAEEQVADEFPSECGACGPGGVLQTNAACNAVSDVLACDGNECYTCGARIDYLVSIGYSQTGAEEQVAEEFPSECGACGPGGAPGGGGSTDIPFSSIVITNSCPYTVWPGMNGRRHSTGGFFFGPVGSPEPAGSELAPGARRVIPIPDGIASFTVWPRTGCAVDVADGRFKCETGECGNPNNNWDGTCFNSGPEGGVTLAEATVLQNAGGAFYDVSLVDGYTIPLGIRAHHGVLQPGVPDEFNCKNPQCDPDTTFNGCPPESRVRANGTLVGCNNIHKAIYNNDALEAFPILQTYRNDLETRSRIECSCLVGNCAGTSTAELLTNLLNGPTLGVDRTGYCCSPFNPLYFSPPEVASHICYVEDKPLPLDGFGGGLRYDEIFKGMCPDAYSWQFDDEESTYQCGGGDLSLEIVFC